MKNASRRDIPSKQLSRDCSFLTGEMKPFELALALDSKFGGNRSSGRTNVWTEQGSDSGGVESSMRTGYPQCAPRCEQKREEWMQWLGCRWEIKVWNRTATGGGRETHY